MIKLEGRVGEESDGGVQSDRRVRIGLLTEFNVGTGRGLIMGMEGGR